MNCLNCSIEVDEGSAAFVVGVYLCQPCGKAGQMLRGKALSGLENMMVSMDEVVRTVLLHKDTAIRLEDVELMGVTDALAFLLATREIEQWTSPQTPSEITRLSASIVDGERSSESPKVAD